ncbi:tyrosine-protein phosphatase [Sphingobium aquiterrae]|uniref:tyrosine-protein phosphatase n=1 Tax=Sphingobium aquiterrae TaxID=2038656 RepID=UPI00301AC280
MMTRCSTMLLALATISVSQSAMAGTVDGAQAERTAAGALSIEWNDRDPVDVFMTDNPAGGISQAKLLSDNDRDGRYVLPAAGVERRYFLLRDEKTKRVVTVAERLLPLEHGSNFRDIGGYPGAGGKHVRWGLIYRSGASAMLSDADIQQVQALRLKELVDLRSSEERVLAPTRIDGVPYTAVGYSMAAVLKPAGGSGEIKNGGTIYRNFPTFLAPQLRIVFDGLLSNKGPIAYNCSAGQDRTGFVTAMILSALGTPRDVIIQDYHLSTKYRQPVNEMPKINLAAHPNDPAAALFAKYQDDPHAAVAQPLKEADGTPFLSSAFDEIDKRWGSVDGYLEKEIGLNKVDIANLRRIYLQ